MKALHYSFHYKDSCNFCGADSSAFKVMGNRMNTSQGMSPRKKIGISTKVVKCKNCGLIFSNPQPVPASLQDHYGIPPESYWVDDYFKVDDTYFVETIDWFEKLYDTKGKKITVLDVGAGLGKAMIAMERRGYDTFGFEPAEPFYKRAIEKMNIRPERLKLAALEDVEYDANTFDFITFGAVLEHVYDPGLALQRSMKWLKPGGLIQIEVPSSDWLVAKIINSAYRLMGTDYVGNISPMHVPFHLHEFSLKSFKAHSELNDYEIADYKYYVCMTYMPKLLDIFIKPYMKWTNQGMQLIIWLRKK